MLSKWLKIKIDRSWVVAVLISSLLMLVISLYIVIFSIPIEFYEALIIVCSIGLFSYLLVLWFVDVFLYNKIKLIYKNINDFKSKPGDLKDVGLKQANKDVSAWNDNKESEIQKLMIRESYRRQFVGNVAHELKTPIFNIQGYIDTLLDGAIEDTTINKKFLERANKSVNRMIHIVEDLDQITKLEGGKIELNEAPVDLVLIISELLDQMELKAKKRDVKLSMSQTQKGRFMVQADIEKIQRVFVNLIDNAIKYGKDL